MTTQCSQHVTYDSTDIYVFHALHAFHGLHVLHEEIGGLGFIDYAFSPGLFSPLKREGVASEWQA
jgi:hypothetical protein